MTDFFKCKQSFAKVLIPHLRHRFVLIVCEKAQIGIPGKPMTYSLQDPRQGLGINTSIYKTVSEYRQPIPVDYLARLHGRSVEEIQPYIDRLEEGNLIKIVNRGNRQYVQQK